ncbi:hypothetical protein [Polyangium aurulentum]|uniref:hypothetical protein n=1 Tax=Polyangium aurulentum TaxID=2567896 RepID=UPI0010AEC628|nr:hypothetical protein [Polyangium aurulentum]UQA62569.1 hypothetical protein E8A73_019785 [Polyangium aurulentum]
MNEKKPFTSTPRVRSLVLITPIKQGFLPHCPAIRYGERLKAVLQGLTERAAEGKPSALDLLESVHFGLWTVIDGGQRLLFVSMYVGDLEPYLKDFSIRVAWGLDLIWTNCEDYPGASNFEPFVAWVKRYMGQSDCFYASNPDMTVVDIKWLKGLHAHFEEFRRDVHCGVEMGPRFTELERRLSQLSADESGAESELLDTLQKSVEESMKDLEERKLFTQEEFEPIKSNFHRMMSEVRGGGHDDQK